MRWILILTFFIFNNSVSAKEWKSLKAYQKATQKQNLSPSDWLKSDRQKNTLIWQKANSYNLINNLPHEYIKIKERRDFYKWMYSELNKQGHEIVWVKMAHYISTKLRKMESFPFSIFSSKKILEYANTGSEMVFNNAFLELNLIYTSNKVYKGNKALLWDEVILHKEQFLWIDSIYKTIDRQSLKKLQRIAKGKFLYGLVVPKAIRFRGNLSNAETRYHYAFHKLRAYCANRYK